MPLQRRLPKRGFNNPFRKEYALVGLGELDAKFAAGSRVDRQSLAEQGLISPQAGPVKILANGEISKPLTVAVEKISGAARDKVVAAGGTVEA